MGRSSWLARLPSAKKRHVEGWAFRPSEGVHMICGRSPCGWWLHLGYPYGAALTPGPNEPQMRSLSQKRRSNPGGKKHKTVGWGCGHQGVDKSGDTSQGDIEACLC